MTKTECCARLTGRARPHRAAPATALALLVAALLQVPALAAKPADFLADYTAKAGAPPSAERGEKFFTTKGAGDLGYSCASCHTSVPTRSGRNALSEKPMAPLAPSANPSRFTDKVKVEGWFKNNCKDVVGRDCTAAEKADVLAWLLSFKP